MGKKIIYVDMDGVLVDLEGYIEKNYTPEYVNMVGIGNIVDEDMNIFYESKPMEGALLAFKQLSINPNFEVYILSTAPWHNPEAWKAKRVWVEKYLGIDGYKRLILSHHKNLLRGDFLIDDRDNNGAAEFGGEHIKFGTKPFETWTQVITYLTQNS